jgi:flavin reductase (DIM6/NTAB) family NADH-FMN oxidoreductase RutF
VDLNQVDPDLFRRVMGCFATGVAVITTAVAGDIHGMTANAFMSASLSPPLCVVSIGTTARMHGHVCATGHYGVSFLSEAQQQTAELSLLPK